ncbi:pyruvate carboxylase [Selenomonadales bacterium OttesenSCG-928-I06]|nr:pyruvate carboxylase [Selenomonadales bacterium OttesenSCG-928-I06]
MNMKKIKTVLVANRGEIAIRIFRACRELNIRTIAVYSKEDVYSLHRYKADESYLVGEGKGPIEAYLDIDGIIDIAKKNDVDAIHPGYGFLSENIMLAQRCKEEGIIFIGPTLDHLDMFGDKINAREKAIEVGIPVIPGSDGTVKSLDEVREFAEKNGYPFIIKAVLGGGGRGMRLVRSEKNLEDAYNLTRSEAKAAFGNDEIYIEKFIENPKHIEVQILGDEYGNLIHLYERDCSVQRRHQKVIEVAPSQALKEETRTAICDAAVKLMKHVNYVSAGTVEFLATLDGKFYFIEVNPRIQVEHTITEMITGVDIVQSQILISDGYSLRDEEVGNLVQENIRCNGHSIQCRITTEDPTNQFTPDTGKIIAYRSPGGFGLRLDAGNAYAGSVITPYYDSLLVKVSVWGRTHKKAVGNMQRALSEFRIRGIKTNTAFLYNVISHKSFIDGTYHTGFLDESPELFVLPQIKDRGTKLLKYLAEVTVNGPHGKGRAIKPKLPKVRIPEKISTEAPRGTKQILEEQGPEGIIKYMKDQKKVLITDTTFRDAHQSLLATRLRTYDMLGIMESTSKLMHNLFAMEVWGGATFDVAYRFLKEDPWQRLTQIREKTPNILLQMLLRASNAVGYMNYPDNLIKAFVKRAAEEGIDLFRIFDSLNWLPGMQVAIDSVRDSGKIAMTAICYTGDILDPTKTKYDLKYYVTMAKELEKAGGHILSIKDMAGVLKPEAAYRLVSALKEAVDIPVHVHTHATTGNAIYTYARAIDAGVDMVDVAVSSMSGLTSQPGASSLYYALDGHERQPEMDVNAFNKISHYWEDVRAFYGHFESSQFFPNPEVYHHAMPGGQYSNLKQQAKAVGLQNRWDEIKEAYELVNRMFGDIVKVTPSSKVVGDMALFMVENNLTEEDVYNNGETLNFPNSVVEFFEGKLGQPYQGFPEKLQKIVLKGKKPITTRPGENLEPIDFEETRKILEEELKDTLGRSISYNDVLSYCLYPKVFLDWADFINTYSDMSTLDTLTFFYGLDDREMVKVEIEKGKTIFVSLVSMDDPLPDGTRVVQFEINGSPRRIAVKDNSVKNVVVSKLKANKKKPEQIGASMSGKVVKVVVDVGMKIRKGATLLITEAMKMETNVQAPYDGIVKEIYVKQDESIETGDLLIEFAKIQ